MGSPSADWTRPVRLGASCLGGVPDSTEPDGPTRLPGDAGGRREELHQRRDPLAVLEERRHERRGGDLLVRERDRSREALALDVLDHRVIRVEPAWRALQRLLRVVERAPGLLPRGRLVRDPLPDRLEDLGLRHPHATGDEAPARLKVQVVAGPVDAVAPELEVRAGMRLVRALVLGEADVTVDPEQRTTRRSRIGDEVGADRAQLGADVRDEIEERLPERPLVPLLVLGEPGPVVVTFQIAQEPERVVVEVPHPSLPQPPVVRRSTGNLSAEPVGVPWDRGGRPMRSMTPLTYGAIPAYGRVEPPHGRGFTCEGSCSVWLAHSVRQGRPLRGVVSGHPQETGRAELPPR